MADSHSPRRSLPPLAIIIATLLATIAAFTTFTVLDDDGSSRADVESDDVDSLTLTPLAEEPGTPASPDPDSTAAALTTPITTLDGTETTLADVIDGPTVVNFFASWCPPCVSEMPHFETVSQDLAGQVTFIGLAMQDRPEDAEKIVANTGITYDWWRDIRGDVAGAAGVVQMPTTMFIDADGEIVGMHPGAVDAGRLRDLIAQHLDVAT